MNLILASDFPATPTSEIVERLRAVGQRPRIAWIPGQSEIGESAFADTRAQFNAMGFDELEVVDIDEERDDVQIAYLHEFEIIYLSGPDAVRFRYNAIRSGLAGRLRQSAARGRLIVGSGHGALLLTPNVSLVRLHQESVDEVLTARGRFDALGLVDYELLPHYEDSDTAFLDRVRTYSRLVEHDIVILAKGGAMLHTAEGFAASVGAITRYRKGNIIES
jgi:peptidase E